MEIMLSALIGILYAAGIYLLLRRSLVKLILGIIFLSNATNLLVFISGGLSGASPDFIREGEKIVHAQYADPLPQALVLTSVVIGFGISALILVLKFKYFQETGTNDLDKVTETENI